jgi:hypothetical protein
LKQAVEKLKLDATKRNLEIDKKLIDLKTELGKSKLPGKGGMGGAGMAGRGGATGKVEAEKDSSPITAAAGRRAPDKSPAGRLNR